MMNINQYNEALKAFEHVLETLASKVPFKTSETAPSTFKGMKEHYETHGYFLIYSGDSDNTIFSSPRYNILFRAWHDAGHYLHGLSFKFENERALGEIQANEARWAALTLGYGLATANRIREIVRAEIIGQIEYYEKNRSYVQDQKAHTMRLLNVA